jgi:hypothetical protein
MSRPVERRGVKTREEVKRGRGRLRQIKRGRGIKGRHDKSRGMEILMAEAFAKIKIFGYRSKREECVFCLL